MGTKIAVVGAGPAGIYAVEALTKWLDDVEIDLFEQTLAPYGLVRYGVAPDHQKIKRVTKVFEKTLSDDRVELWGNVFIGKDIHPYDLTSAYDAVLYTTGCAERRTLGIPGEDLAGYHGAPEFVAWYNGHPHFITYRPSLRTRSAVVIGAGNVSMDVARMLLLDYGDVAKTDVPDYALDEFRANEVRDVHVLIRRGPERVAFDLKELRDITEIPRVTVIVRQDDLPLVVDPSLPSSDRKKLELLQEHVHNTAPAGGRRMFLHFFRSPVELVGSDGAVSHVKVEHTKVVRTNGAERAVGTGEFSNLDAGLVVSAAGYRGTPIEGLPFDPRSGTIPNVEGRVIAADGAPLSGVYVAGWIKRGPTGVIGTNKACAVATVKCILEDLSAISEREAKPGRAAIADLLEAAAVRSISWRDWQRLEEEEVRRGSAAGKVREKFLTAAQCFDALDEQK